MEQKLACLACLILTLIGVIEATDATVMLLGIDESPLRYLLVLTTSIGTGDLWVRLLCAFGILKVD